jgi:hypothetical protein
LLVFEVAKGYINSGGDIQTRERQKVKSQSLFGPCFFTVEYGPTAASLSARVCWE